MLAHSITLALKGRWYGNYGFVRCVAHKDGRPSLRVRDGDKGGLLVHCYAGCDRQIILGELRAQNLLSGAAPSDEQLAAARRHQDFADAKRKQDQISRAFKVWRDSTAISATPAELYLRNRRITLSLPPSLRCHRSLLCTEDNCYHPAVVGALQTADRRIVAVHRIYITQAGDKAALGTIKTSLGPTSAAAVRLAASTPHMAVGEGIETCLSYMQLTGIPTWAALTTAGIKQFQVPPCVTSLDILVDRDAHGASEKAARALMERYPQLQCALRMSRTGKDFNDDLQMDGGGK